MQRATTAAARITQVEHRSFLRRGTGSCSQGGCSVQTNVKNQNSRSLPTRAIVAKACVPDLQSVPVRPFSGRAGYGTPEAITAGATITRNDVQGNPICRRDDSWTNKLPKLPLASLSKEQSQANVRLEKWLSISFADIKPVIGLYISGGCIDKIRLWAADKKGQSGSLPKKDWLPTAAQDRHSDL